jgi:O-antigen/teichoic acid export membrane protein
MEARKIAENSFFSGLSVFIDRFGAIVFTIIIARILQPEFFGLYTFAVSIGYLFMGFTDLGVNNSQIVWVSEALGKDDKTLARSYLRYFLKIKFLAVCMVSLLVFIFSIPIASYFGKIDMILIIQITSIFIFLQSMLNFFSEIFQSVQVFKYKAIYNFIFQVTRIVLVPVFLVFSFAVESALIGVVLSLFLTIAAILYILAKKYRFLFYGPVVRFDRKIILKFTGWMTVGSIASMVFGYFDVVLIGFLLPIENAGFYRAATSIIFSIAGVLNAVTGNIFLPIFSQKKIDDIKPLFKKCMKYSAIISFPFVIITILFGEGIVEILYGDSYLSATLPLMILSFIVFENVLSSFYGMLLSAQKHPHYSAYIVVVFSLLNIVLNYALITSIGIVGGAISLLVSRYFYFFFMALITKVKLDVSPSIVSLVKPIFSALIVMAAFIFLPKPDNIIIGILELCLYMVAYGAILYCMNGFNKDDIDFVRRICKS